MYTGICLKYITRETVRKCVSRRRRRRRYQAIIHPDARITSSNSSNSSKPERSPSIHTARILRAFSISHYARIRLYVLFAYTYIIAAQFWHAVGRQNAPSPLRTPASSRWCCSADRPCYRARRAPLPFSAYRARAAPPWLCSREKQLWPRARENKLLARELITLLLG